MRKKIIAGNWKMNKTVTDAIALVKDLKTEISEQSAVDVVICPPFTAIYPVRETLSGSSIHLGAQDMFWKPSGAYTSQISAPMLLDLGVKYVIVGHSETRGRFGVSEDGWTEHHSAIFGESNETVSLKVQAALTAGLCPIVCVGETLAERNAGQTDSIVQGQVKWALEGTDADNVASHLIFAYEPVWAIGTGEVCAADEADRVCGVVRSAVGHALGLPVAEAVRVQYGGSMKPDNAAELLSKPNIDGGLIGGASLKAADFAAIINAAPKN